MGIGPWPTTNPPQVALTGRLAILPDLPEIQLIGSDAGGGTPGTTVVAAGAAYSSADLGCNGYRQVGGAAVIAGTSPSWSVVLRPRSSLPSTVPDYTPGATSGTKTTLSANTGILNFFGATNIVSLNNLGSNSLTIQYLYVKVE